MTIFSHCSAFNFMSKDYCDKSLGFIAIRLLICIGSIVMAIRFSL